jgi:hypothetical protein
MSEYAPPSGDPADDDSLAGTLRAVFKKQLQNTDDMLPAIVVAYDRVKNRANVRPLIAVLTTDNRAVDRAPLASVPVMQFGGGDIVLNFNLKPGNLGWIKANDRDISTFLQSYGNTTPNTVRLHSFEDAVFVPDVMRGWVIAGEDDEAAVLQTLDGSVKVSVSAARVKLAFGAKSVTVDGSGTTIVGGLVVDGITFGTHRHPDPQGGNTGGPIN